MRSIFKWAGRILGLLLLVFLISLIIPEREVVPAIQPRPSTAYWQMKEGFKIAYSYLPNRDTTQRPPIIFLHGGPGGYVHSSIIKTLEKLTNVGHDVYLYDQRGSGLSDRLSHFSDVNFEKHLEDLHEIITQHVKAPKVILMGQSFGCILIAHYSGRHPEKIASLILSSPGDLPPIRQNQGQVLNLDSIYPAPDSLKFIPPFDGFKASRRAALKTKAIVATMGALILDKKLIPDRQMDRILNTMASKFTKGMVCDVANVLPEEGGGGLYAYMATNNNDVPEIRSKLTQVPSPVLVLQGQCDYIPFWAAFEYVDLYPNARYVFIEGAGHEIWWEQEAIFLKHIKQFLSE